MTDTGLEGVVAMSSGFVEGSVSRIVVTMCKSGALGEALGEAPADVVGSLVFLTIEAIISGYSFAKGDISAEEYGCLLTDASSNRAKLSIVAVSPG